VEECAAITVALPTTARRPGEAREILAITPRSAALAVTSEQIARPARTDDAGLLAEAERGLDRNPNGSTIRFEARRRALGHAWEYGDQLPESDPGRDALATTIEPKLESWEKGCGASTMRRARAGEVPMGMPP